MFNYIGPSWANTSFDAPGVVPTNLAKEWGFPHRDLSQPGVTVPWLISRFINTASNTSDPIIWIYNEPINVLTLVTGLSFTDYLVREDWKDIWDECNQYCLTEINKLNRPVLLIGAHSDIVDCEYSNIVVGHRSWQKWIAKEVGMEFNEDSVLVTPDDGSRFFVHRGWGAEVVHRHMWEHPEISPCQSLVDNIWDIFFFWKELEKHDMFFDVHPNKKATIGFAEFLKPTIEQFLQDTKSA